MMATSTSTSTLTDCKPCKENELIVALDASTCGAVYMWREKGKLWDYVVPSCGYGVSSTTLRTPPAANTTIKWFTPVTVEHKK